MAASQKMTLRCEKIALSWNAPHGAEGVTNWLRSAQKTTTSWPDKNKTPSWLEASWEDKAHSTKVSLARDGAKLPAAILEF